MKNVFWIILSAIFLFTSSFTGKIKEPPTDDFQNFLFEYLAVKYPKYQFENFIYVGIKRQKLHLFKDGKLVESYDVSTSKNGAGTQEGSEMTPVGLHQLYRKYGEDVPEAGILRGKRFTGAIAEVVQDSVSTGKDDITSRVITMKGLEEGINLGGNIDSYDRKIYIHGTAEEGLIGQPASHGCIRMRNKDIIKMFDQVDTGMYLVILNN